MQTLDVELKVQNRSLKQIKRSGMVALYELYGPQGMLYGYEVHVIRVRKAHEAFGKSFPEMEGSPLNEDWGTYGWSYQPNELLRAQKRFDNLLPKYGLNVGRSLA